MRVLLMVSNRNMAARELYGTILRERHPGWAISNMSGLPTDPGAIIRSFDVLVYELGAPDDPRRFQDVLSLLAEIEGGAGTCVITHVEGPYRDGIVAELESHGVVCVAAPFSPQSIADAFARVAPAAGQASDRANAPGLGARLRSVFRRKE